VPANPAGPLARKVARGLGNAAGSPDNPHTGKLGDPMGLWPLNSAPLAATAGGEAPAATLTPTRRPRACRIWTRLRQGWRAAAGEPAKALRIWPTWVQAFRRAPPNLRLPAWVRPARPESSLEGFAMAPGSTTTSGRNLPGEAGTSGFQRRPWRLRHPSVPSGLGRPAQAMRPAARQRRAANRRITVWEQELGLARVSPAGVLFPFSRPGDGAYGPVRQFPLGRTILFRFGAWCERASRRCRSWNAAMPSAQRQRLNATRCRMIVPPPFSLVRI